MTPFKEFEEQETKQNQHNALLEIVKKFMSNSNRELFGTTWSQSNPHT